MSGRGRARGRRGRVRGSPVSARKGKNEIEVTYGMYNSCTLGACNIPVHNFLFSGE